MTIIPTSITNFNRNTRELQAFWLFCVCVAGRNAKQVAAKVNQLTETIPKNLFPFDWFRMKDIRAVLEFHKMGQYGRISEAIKQSLDLDLQNATLPQLMSIKGVGPKTARFFLLHSQKDCNCAVLDVHILRYMKQLQFWPDVPTSTPPPKEYATWENRFLGLCDTYWPHLSVAEVDLMLWKIGSQK